MALNSYSIFYYDYIITTRNNAINFDEGSGELLAEVAVGSYSAEDLMTAVKTAMDAVGTLEYTVFFDRETRKVTISTTTNFDILVATGTQLGVTCLDLLGFTGADLTSASSYTGNLVCGSSYEPQFFLEDYKNPDMVKDRVAASVNEAASGELEVISFGVRRFLEFSLKWINNYPQPPQYIKENLTGFESTVDFMTYLSSKGPFEFMPDIKDKNTFYTLVLEKTSSSSKGTGYEIRELASRGLPGYYEVNAIKCRVIE